MATLEARFIPSDRLHALATGVSLPSIAQGSAMFADISGFTSVTERLRAKSGARRGAEELVAHLNRVYDALVAEVERYGGSIIGFAGDAITCWFGGEASAARATTCGFALLVAMSGVEQIALPDGETLHVSLKVVVTSGTTRRFLVGDPNVQVIDTLAGEVAARLARGGTLAERSELLIDDQTVDRLSDSAVVRSWRQSEGERFAVMERITRPSDVVSSDHAALAPPQTETLLQWLLPDVARHIRAGLGEFEIELRPAVALFLRFSGIDYDYDSNAEEKLKRLVSLTQATVRRYDGNVLQVTIGDKGSYLYAVFGAPFAHEDDVLRTLTVALELREAISALGYLDPVQIGISRGMMRAGAYGASTRRTYGVQGDEVNLAAHLMNRAEPGEILVSESLSSADVSSFALERLPPVQIKGKANAVSVFRLLGHRDRSFEERFYSTPLVGREAEMAALDQALQPILAGQSAGVIWIYGEPGMGKSRLAFEAQKRLQSGRAVTWLTGQADALNRAQLGAFAYFLRPSFGQRRDRDSAANLASFDRAFDGLLALADETTRADLAHSRSFLAGIVGLSVPDSPDELLDEKSRIDNRIAAIKAWVRAESVRQPLVVHLEDAQWLDPSSIRAVQQLTYNMEKVPLALVMTSRYDDDSTPFTIPDLYSAPVHMLDLNRLSNEGVGAVTAAIVAKPISERLAAFVHQRAEGNPFFAEQLVFDLQERGVLVQAEGQWDIRPDAASEVPSRVNEVLIARLDRLANQVKSVVQTAAVLGREFEIEVLSRMLRQDEVTAVREAEREGIWSALDALRYLFRHALLRDAAYEMQAHERLKALHRMAAVAIEALFPDDVTQHEALLEHWHRGDVSEKALHYTVPVCERLVRITADYARAERLLRRGLSLGETPYHTVLLRQFGDAARLRGQYEAAVDHYEASLNAPGDNVMERIQALNGLGKVHMQHGEYPKAMEVIEQARRLAEEGQYLAQLADVFMTLGTLVFRQGDNDAANTYFSEGLHMYRELGNQPGIADALQNLAGVASIRANHSLARTYLEEALARFKVMGSRQQMAGVLNNLGTAALQQGDFQAARPYYEASLSIRREIGDRNGIGATLSNLAILALRQGNLSEAQAYGEASLRERRAIGDRRGISNSLSIVAVIAYDQNENAAAQRYFEEILEMQRAINDRWGMATTLGNLGEIAGFAGRFAEAQAYLQEGLALYRQLDQPLGISNTLVAQGDVAYEQGELLVARELIQEALDIRRKINDQNGIPLCLAALGYLDAESGALAQAENQLVEALILLRELNLGELPRALATLAVARRAMGRDRDSIYPLLREALSLEQARSSLRRMLLVLVEVARLLLLDERHMSLGELIGLILKQDISYKARLTVNQLLEDLRPHLDATSLDATLERGKSLDVDEAVAHILTELG